MVLPEAHSQPAVPSPQSPAGLAATAEVSALKTELQDLDLRNNKLKARLELLEARVNPSKLLAKVENNAQLFARMGLSR